MKRLFVLLTALFALTQMNAQEKKNIRISTDNTDLILQVADRKSTRLNSSHIEESRMPSSA